MTLIEAVVPVLNEELIIDELVARLSAAMGSFTEDWGVVLVDDGSTDGTWAAIAAASAREPRVRGRRFSRNFGQHVAITAGLEASEAEWVVVMDGDLQDRPEVIPRLYEKASQGYEVVFVARKNRPISPAYRLAQSIFYGALRFLAQTEYNPAFGNFSILNRRVVHAYSALSESHRFYGGLIFWLGFRRAFIEADHDRRFAGEPSYNLRRRIRLASDIILAYSVRPLHAAIVLGVCSTVFSFSYGLYVMWRALHGDVSIEGWASIIVSIYFVGGLLMTMVGMNGVYLGRVHEELKRRPLYVVSEDTPRRPRG